MNLGSGPDIKKGWVNTDSRVYPALDPVVKQWDATIPPPDDLVDEYDFILVNHVLCTMKEQDAMKVLRNCHLLLGEHGRLHVIDMDLIKVFEAYQRGDSDSIPIETGDIDSKLCHAISGYGTRLSLYTEKHLQNLLLDVGFKKTAILNFSPHDTRPKESLIVEAIK